MLIKNKILSTLIIFIFVVVLEGMIFIFFGNKQINHFETTETYVKASEIIKTSANIYEEQIRAYEYYVYLNENLEKHTFNEKKEELLEKIQSGIELDVIDLSDLNRKLIALNELFARSFAIISRQSRAAATEATEEEAYKQINEVREIFKKLINIVETGVYLSRKKALSYSQAARNYSVGFLLFAMGILSLMSLNTYKTIINPLKRMEKAAKTFGMGDLEYRMEIRDKNEFMSIANAFNQMADDLKEFNVKITQMGKMVAIGELAGGVAHEINNPLTGILGNVQLLQSKCSGDTVQKLLQKTERAAIRCRDIVADLLDFSRKDNSEVDVVSINDLIDDTFSFSETEMRSKNIKLVKQYAENIPKIQVSPRTLQQAFLNIINNAIQAMGESGTLTIKTALIEREGEKFIEIAFKDTGCGFDVQTAKYLFDPFYTTREVGSGTGLGLSLTYRIIKNHQGDIKAHSDGPKKGAAFIIHIPVNKTA